METRPLLDFEPKRQNSPKVKKPPPTKAQTPPHAKAQDPPPPVGTGNIRHVRHLVGTTAHRGPDNNWLKYAHANLAAYGATQTECPCNNQSVDTPAATGPHTLADRSVGAHVCVVLPTGEVFIGVTPTCSTCNTKNWTFTTPFTLVTVASIACGTFVGSINPNTADANATHASVPALTKINTIEVAMSNLEVKDTNLKLGGVARDGSTQVMHTAVADPDDFMLQLAVLSRNRIRHTRIAADAKLVSHVPVVVRVDPKTSTYMILQLPRGDDEEGEGSGSG